MNVKEQQVTNAANLAMFMVNVSHALAAQMRSNEQIFCIIYLKALYRRRKYVLEILKYLPHPPDLFYALTFCQYWHSQHCQLSS